VPHYAWVPPARHHQNTRLRRGGRRTGSAWRPSLCCAAAPFGILARPNAYLLRVALACARLLALRAARGTPALLRALARSNCQHLRIYAHLIPAFLQAFHVKKDMLRHLAPSLHIRLSGPFSAAVRLWPQRRLRRSHNLQHAQPAWGSPHASPLANCQHLDLTSHFALHHYAPYLRQTGGGGTHKHAATLSATPLLRALRIRRFCRRALPRVCIACGVAARAAGDVAKRMTHRRARTPAVASAPRCIRA